MEANDHEARRVALYVGPPQGPLQPVQPPGRARSDIAAGFATATRDFPVVHEIAWPPASLGPIFLYAASEDGRDFDLFLSGSGPVASSPAADGGPAWSPDGRWIAFTSARTGQGDLYLADATALDAPPRRLTSLATSSELYPAWSRDGGMLVWVAHSRTGDHLYLLRDLDGAPERLTSWPGSQLRPRFSPARDELAFYANHEDPSRFDLYAVDARPGAAPRLLLRGVVPDSAGPSWTPDGASLVAVLDDDDAYDPVVAVPRAGGAPRVVELGTVGHGDLALATRDGATWIAWVAQGRRGDPVRDFKRLFVAPLP